MKKLLALSTLLLVQSALLAQTYLDEGFSGAFPPAGWTIDAQSSHWKANNSNNAGGTAPEARFDWNPAGIFTSRLTSPAINSTGNTSLKVQFKQMVDHYDGPYTLGVATRSGGGGWNIVWSITPSASVGPTTELVTITNSDVGASDFQICWFFDGNSNNINYWYIDDIKLFVTQSHDVMVRSIIVNSQHAPESNLIPQAIVRNNGLNPETFDATCVIKAMGSSVYTQNSSTLTLQPDSQKTINFPSFTTSPANELFDIGVTSNLAADQDSTNNTITSNFNTYVTPRDMVILEIGTGTWCQYCPGASLGANDLLTNGRTVGVVEYHNNDPFTNSYSNARNTYYGVSGYPTAFFDGVLSFVGGSHTQSMYSSYLPLYQERKAVNTAFTLGINGSKTGSSCTANIIVKKVAAISANWSNLVLHLVLTESSIQFPWQDQTEVDDAERLMVPDENGTPLNFVASDSLQIALTFTLQADWVAGESELVAFIQNKDTKEILQGTKLGLSALTGVSYDRTNVPFEFALGQNYPNPFNPNTTITYAVAKYSFVNMIVYNMIGQELATLVNEVKAPGRYNIDFNASTLASGTYFYKMVTSDFVQVKKMTVLK